MTPKAWHATSLPWQLSGSREYRPISSYGVIGDLHTAALVGLDGSIDWCCFPDFDSSSVFGALLDAARGGSFAISPAAPSTSEQRYATATNVLVTTFNLDAGGVLELTDFMPVTQSGHRRDFPEIHRRVRCARGEGEVVIRFAPRFDYGMPMVRLQPRAHGVLATDGQDEVVTLAGPRDMWWRFDSGVAIASLKLRVGEEVWFVVRYDDDEVRAVGRYCSNERLEETASFWSTWSSHIQYTGQYRDVVERSALALKLMCYQPTGAIVAAPTTSLPEQIGGVRNWDYRFTWLRDSAFVLYSLNILGHFDEADRFMRFLKRVCRKTDDTHLQVMYGIDGRRRLTERSLDHLSGYRNSRPVRVGNGAYDQLQLDVYGEVLETAYLWSRRHEVTEGTWATLHRLVNWVADNWQRPDSGLWEARSGLQHYVFSKVMCWVALDRGIRLARRFGLVADLTRWRDERAAVHADVMTNGWNEAQQSFTQYYGTESLDAANLVIPMVHFLPSDHPRVRGTVMATLRELTGPDREFVYRYRNDDGLPGEEGAFSICTFWLAEALALIGELDHGERIFQRMLKQANHLGLYSEELDPVTGEFLGNFPQAFTHIAQINCAHVLETLKRRRTRKQGES